MDEYALLHLVNADGPDLLEEVRSLIEAGADVGATTKYRESALRAASRNARFDVVQLLLESGADASQLGWSRSFVPFIYGTIDELQDSIIQHEDLEDRDWWERTPWLIAVQMGDTQKEQTLLDLGANRWAVGRWGKTSMTYAAESGDVAMLRWLVDLGLDIDATDKLQQTALHSAAESGRTECARFLVESGADFTIKDYIGRKAIQMASNLDIVDMLIAGGDDLGEICDETRALLLGVAYQGCPAVSRETYLGGKHRRFGTQNPEKTNVDFWVEIIRCGADAYSAQVAYGGRERPSSGPVWCYVRFGRTTTRLRDGRIVEIGGEHEDHYDSDFCIYNDVVVFQKPGTFDIHSYPEDVFPPTDGHTATLVGDSIYVIGNLGYYGKRCHGFTQVLRLHLDSMKMEPLETTGDMPGWIGGHKAQLDSAASIVVSGGEVCVVDENERSGEKFIANDEKFRLDLKTFQWSKAE